MSTIQAVDADSLSRKRLTELLGQAGHRFVEASAGEDCLMIAKSERRDLTIIAPVIPYRCR